MSKKTNLNWKFTLLASFMLSYTSLILFLFFLNSYEESLFLNNPFFLFFIIDDNKIYHLSNLFDVFFFPVVSFFIAILYYRSFANIRKFSKKLGYKKTPIVLTLLIPFSIFFLFCIIIAITGYIVLKLI